MAADDNEPTWHRHELDGEWFGHRHDNDGPHHHRHTPAEAEEHEEAVEEDGSCPVCGEVHELTEDEVEDAEEAEEAGEETGEDVGSAATEETDVHNASDDKEDEHGEDDREEDKTDDEGEHDKEPTPVRVPPQDNSDGASRRRKVEMSRFRSHRHH